MTDPLPRTPAPTLVDFAKDLAAQPRAAVIVTDDEMRESLNEESDRTEPTRCKCGHTRDEHSAHACQVRNPNPCPCNQWERAEPEARTAPSPITPTQKSAGQLLRIELVNAIEMFDRSGWTRGGALSALLDQCEQNRDQLASLSTRLEAAERERDTERRQHQTTLEVEAACRERIASLESSLSSLQEAVTQLHRYGYEDGAYIARRSNGEYIRRDEVLALLVPHRDNQLKHSLPSSPPEDNG